MRKGASNEGDVAGNLFSQLITDCMITEGNPADMEFTVGMLDRQNEIYGRYPLRAALDGGFPSQANLQAAKGKGIKDVCFAKKKGLEELDMYRSHWVAKRLRNFRAGVESVISWIKRSLGFDRCTWKRSQAVKAAAEPEHLTADNKMRKVSRRSIYRWLAAFEAQGFIGLLPAVRPRVEDSKVLEPPLIDF